MSKTKRETHSSERLFTNASLSDVESDESGSQSRKRLVHQVERFRSASSATNVPRQIITSDTTRRVRAFASSSMAFKLIITRLRSVFFYLCRYLSFPKWRFLQCARHTKINSMQLLKKKIAQFSECRAKPTQSCSQIESVFVAHHKRLISYKRRRKA